MVKNRNVDMAIVRYVTKLTSLMHQFHDQFFKSDLSCEVTSMQNVYVYMLCTQHVHFQATKWQQYPRC